MILGVTAGLSLILLGGYVALTLTHGVPWSIPIFGVGIGLVLYLTIGNRRLPTRQPRLRRTSDLASLFLNAGLLGGILMVANVAAFRYGGRGIDLTARANLLPFVAIHQSTPELESPGHISHRLRQRTRSARYHPPGGLGVRIDLAVYHGYLFRLLRLAGRQAHRSRQDPRRMPDAAEAGTRRIRRRRHRDDAVVVPRAWCERTEIIDGDYHIHWLEEAFLRAARSSNSELRSRRPAPVSWRARSPPVLATLDFMALARTRPTKTAHKASRQKSSPQTRAAASSMPPGRRRTDRQIGAIVRAHAGASVVPSMLPAQD